MMQDIIATYSIICDLNEIKKKTKIRSSRKLLDIQYQHNLIHKDYGASETVEHKE